MQTHRSQWQMLSNYAEQAVHNLTVAKMRSSLAILGVLIGTAAIVALINCGQLATDKALAEFKTLGTNLVSISLFQPNLAATQTKTNTLSIGTWRSFPKAIPNVKNIAPYSTAYQAMSIDGHHLSGSIIGVNEDLQSIIHIKLASGRFISSLESFEPVCVIGYDIAKQLQQYSLKNPLGKSVRIGKRLYTIIGITSQWKENTFFNENINQAVMVPILGMKLINKSAQINNAILLINPNTSIDTLTANIKHLIHLYAPESNIFLRSAKQIIASMESQGHTFTLLLGVIGGISLLVGGIGVMNVMLVSVSERTKEIGIRKAIGATNRDLQALFLSESILLSLLGGTLGVIIGIIFTWIVAYFSGWNFRIHLIPIIVGFTVSVTTGLFFGFYPAKKAAQLQPIVCLRQE